MYFKNDMRHEKMYRGLTNRVGQEWGREYNSALYVLAAIRKPMQDYVKPGIINFSELTRESEVWSSSEKALIRLAATLFNFGTWPVPIGDVFRHLDEENTKAALQALEIRYLMRSE